MRVSHLLGLGLLVLVVASAAITPFKVAPEEEALIIAQDGRIVRKVSDGWHLRIPFLQSVYVQKTLIERQTLVADATSQDQCNLEIAVHWNIRDLIRFHQTIRKTDLVDARIVALASEKARGVRLAEAPAPDTACAEFLKEDDVWERTGLNVIRTRVDVGACP